MAGTIFYRERMNVGEGEKAPRFLVVASGRRQAQRSTPSTCARANSSRLPRRFGAELVELAIEEQGHKLTPAE